MKDDDDILPVVLSAAASLVIALLVIAGLMWVVVEFSGDKPPAHASLPWSPR